MVTNDIASRNGGGWNGIIVRRITGSTSITYQPGTIKCFEAGKWHHIALTVDSGGNAVGYVNGYPVVSGTYTSVAAVGSRVGTFTLACGTGGSNLPKILNVRSEYV